MATVEKRERFYLNDSDGAYTTMIVEERGESGGTKKYPYVRHEMHVVTSHYGHGTTCIIGLSGRHHVDALIEALKRTRERMPPPSVYADRAVWTLRDGAPVLKRDLAEDDDCDSSDLNV